MSLIPPLSVTVSAKRRACVLDTDLALSRFGLLLALRICEEFDLWLVRELWHILDNLECYPEVPEKLLADSPGNGSATSWLQWEMARMESDLAGLNIFWIGDEKYESLLPKGVDQNLVHRFRKLDESLHRQRHGKKKGQYNFFGECMRQAAALNAALIPFRGFILTRQGPPVNGGHETEPAICSYLKEQRIQCFQVRQEKQAQMEKEFLGPIMARTGISELLWAGLRLAVVHLVVPNAIIIPPVMKDEADLSRKLGPLPEEKDHHHINWWEGAVSFWYPLRLD
jgi:hypothetical protein